MGIGPLDRVAARVAARPRRGRSSGPAASRSRTGVVLLVARRRLVDPGPDRVHVLGVRAGHDRARVRARHAARRALTGESVAARVRALVGRNRRRYGGYVVHAAIVLLAIGVAGSSAYDSVAEGQARARGSRSTVGDYTLTYRALTERDDAQRDRGPRARSTSSRGGESLGTLEAGKNAYAAEQQVSNEVGIRTDLPDRRGPVRDRRAGRTTTAPSTSGSSSSRS